MEGDAALTDADAASDEERADANGDAPNLPGEADLATNTTDAATANTTDAATAPDDPSGADPAASDEPPATGTDDADNADDANSADNADDATDAPQPPAYQPRTRTYYIAAEEIDWDYAPDHMNVAMGRPFAEEERVFTEGNGVDRIGSKYRKALYREYTDDSFETRKPRPAAEGYLGMLGPILHGVVGDTLKVVFLNAGNRPYSVHPHGVQYDKASEGAASNDGTDASDKRDDRVEPGQIYTYVWHVTERAGPGPADPSSIAWLYHSHIDGGIADEYAGLIGAIVVTDAAHGTESGVPSDVDREVTSLFMVDDENASILLDDNIAACAPMIADLDDEEFYESNLMHTINGYVYGNGPRLTIRQGQRVRWYLLTMGTEVDLHTPHWHGNTVLDEGRRTDVVELLPASMRTVDMIPDNPGTWMFHCHVNDHIEAGMMSLYDVLPADDAEDS